VGGMNKTKKFRRPGLQQRWLHVVNSLEGIIPAYELGSNRIAFFADTRMRTQAVNFAVRKDEVVLDIGSGPGVMARAVEGAGGTPLLLDVSRRMLSVSPHSLKVQASFEHLPFRDEAFNGIVCGFALRDSLDLMDALREIRRVLRRDGRFGFCDLGKPTSTLRMLVIAVYLRLFAPLIGLLSAGWVGLKFGSIFDTYMLVLDNDQLERLLSRFFSEVKMTKLQMGGAIIVECSGTA